MPSGLTYKIYDGSDMSLRDFALTCVKQLGAGYKVTNQGEKEMPRDKAPVVEVSDYHAKQLELSKKQLDDWLRIKKNPEISKRLYNDAHKKRIVERNEIDEHREEIKARYLTMKAKVESWEIGEEYQSLKDLMLKQLNESIDWDCAPRPVQEEEYTETLDEWIEANIEYCKKSIALHTEGLEREIAGVAKLNDYLKGLYDAIDKFEETENKVQY